MTSDATVRDEQSPMTKFASGLVPVEGDTAANPSSQGTSPRLIDATLDQKILGVLGPDNAAARYADDRQFRLTYLVAQEMESRDLWRFYLSEDEHRIFQAALHNLSTWHSFISLDSKFKILLEYMDQEQQQQQQKNQSESQQTTLPSSDPSGPSQSSQDGDVEMKSASSTQSSQVLDPNSSQEFLAGARSPFSVQIKVESNDGDARYLLANAASPSHPGTPLRSSSIPPHAARALTPSRTSPMLKPKWEQESSSASVPNQASQKSSEDAQSLQPIPAQPPVSIPTTAFRTRAMIFEQLLSKVYPSARSCCHPPIDIQSLEEKLDSGQALPMPNVLLPSIAVPVNGNNSTSNRSRMQEDNDYDQEDQTNDAAAQPTPGSSQPQKDVVGSTANPFVVDRRSHPIRLPLHHLYYTLEHDVDAMIEQQQLEEADNNQEEENQGGGGLAAENMLSQLGAGSFSMKYLLHAIESNRSASSLSDRELRSLLSDVRPNRSKWANEDKVGQEELYENCERVLLELRNYTEHSTPFLNKVSKREAPDYFQIIKHPMDLGTVMKKLKSLAYQSKRQFADDLYLIYANCLKYNSDPSNIFRTHANAMKKKTQILLETVPDITIRDRAELEAEAEAEESDEETESQAGRAPGEASEGHGKKATSSSKTVHKATAGKVGKNVKDVPSGSETPKTGMDIDSALRGTPVRELSREPTSMTSIAAAADGSSTPLDNSIRAGTPNGAAQSPARVRRLSRTSVPVEVAEGEAGEDRDFAEDMFTSQGDILFQEWKEKTKKTRAKIVSTRESQQQLPFADQQALERLSTDMKKAYNIERMHDNIFDFMTLRRRKCKSKHRSAFAPARPLGFGMHEDEEDGEEQDQAAERDVFSRNLFAPPEIKSAEEKAKKEFVFLPEYATRAGMPEAVDGGALGQQDFSMKLFDERAIA
ncbi:Transcriptional activator spt7, partial [Actinomortierella ambigua]